MEVLVWTSGRGRSGYLLVRCCRGTKVLIQIQLRHNRFLSSKSTCRLSRVGCRRPIDDIIIDCRDIHCQSLFLNVTQPVNEITITVIATDKIISLTELNWLLDIYYGGLLAFLLFGLFLSFFSSSRGSRSLGCSSFSFIVFILFPSH